jgi:hypothetical protein
MILDGPIRPGNDTNVHNLSGSGRGGTPFSRAAHPAPAFMWLHGSTTRSVSSALAIVIKKDNFNMDRGDLLPGKGISVAAALLKVATSLIFRIPKSLEK